MKTLPLQQTPSGGLMPRLVSLLLGKPRTANMVTLTSSDLGDKLLAASRKADLIQVPKPIAWYHDDFGVIELSHVHRVGWKPLYSLANANVDLPDAAAQDFASKSNNPAVSG